MDDGAEIIDFETAARMAGVLRISWNSEEAIQRQRALIEEWGEQNGIQIVGYVDNGVAGDAPIYKRTGLPAALAAVEDGTLGGIIATSPDRFARNAFIAAQIRHRVWKAGGRVITIATGEILRSELDPESERMQVSLDRMDEDEILAIRARRYRGRMDKLARGGYIGGQRYGGRPYGRELVQDLSREGISDYRPIPEEQAVIRRLCAQHGDGIAYRELARKLNAEGVPTVTGVPWSHKVVRDLILRGPTGLATVLTKRAAVPGVLGGTGSASSVTWLGSDQRRSA